MAKPKTTISILRDVIMKERRPFHKPTRAMVDRRKAASKKACRKGGY